MRARTSLEHIRQVLTHDAEDLDDANLSEHRRALKAQKAKHEIALAQGVNGGGQPTPTNVERHLGRAGRFAPLAPASSRAPASQHWRSCDWH